MNIAIGKSGKACYFDKNKWDIANGDDSPLIVYYELCKRYPQHKFYMIGSSDIERCRKKGIFVPENMIDLYSEARHTWKHDPEHKHEELWMYLLDLVNERNIKFDFGIIMQGPDMSVSLKGVGIKNVRNPEKDINPLCMATNYVAPIQGIINDQRFPWIIMNEDARYVPIANRDIIPGHDELLILSQNTGTYEVKRIMGYYEKSTEFRKHKLNYRYAGIEKLWLAREKKIDFSNPDHIVVGDNVYKKTNKFIMTLNQGGDRLKMLEKWIFSVKPDQIIYGKWTEKTWGDHKDNFVDKKIVDMQEDIWSSMFTYVPGYLKARSNFVTKKVWTMMYHGIIPFFDKNGYDTDRLLPVPDVCRVETPQEMWDRIDYYYNNRDEYVKLLNEIYDLLKDSYFNGDYIDNILGPFIKKFDNLNLAEVK